MQPRAAVVLIVERLISNVVHLIINPPPPQSVFDFAFCYQLSLSVIALLHKDKKTVRRKRL